MLGLKEREKLKDFVVILAERMQQTPYGKWETVRVKSVELSAKHFGYWITENFGCATRVVKEKYGPGYEVQVQKAKKHPFTK